MSMDEEIHFKSVIDTDFKLSILDRLNSLRKENVLCDAVIQIGGKTHPVHKNVLCAASPFFRGLFTNDMQEKNQEHIELQVISGDVGEEVISFMYTGAIKVEKENAQDIVMAGDFLLIPSLKSAAARFLEATLNAENCVFLRDFAIRYNCSALGEAANCLIDRSFVDISRASYFRELSYETVVELVSRNEINVSKEEEVLTAIFRWIKHEPIARKQYIHSLIGKVRMFSLSKYTIQECLYEENLIFEDPICTQMFIEGLQIHLFPDSMLNKLIRPRDSLWDTAFMVVISGGHSAPMKPIPHLLAYDLISGVWYHFPSSNLSVPRTRHCATVCEGYLYILGGTPCQIMEKFDHRLKSWSHDFSDIDNPVMHAAVVTHKEKIILIGGENRLNEASNVLSIVQEYDPKVNKWRYLAKMKCGRAAHIAALIGDHIYVAGGFGDKSVHGCGEKYSIETNEWVGIADMQSRRRFAAGCAINGKLFVAGGYHAEDWIAYSSCEIYNPASDLWCMVSNMPEPRAACGVVKIEGSVFLFGGENGGRPNDKLGSVVQYSVDNDSWELQRPMPEVRSCLQACTVYLPRQTFLTLEPKSDEELFL
ncbi:kelch-like protein 12 [Nematostella vectensis]|uniref:kelch-like protein 12 n=1 Tax=Nematostella vectensis TaxID=45351 RepID=UPI002076E7FD|nr:kelch-like protein 12 [Nematostella vectensis]